MGVSPMSSRRPAAETANAWAGRPCYEEIDMIDRETFEQLFTRRAFLRRSAGGLGATVLASLLNPEMLLGAAPATTQATTQAATRAAAGPTTVPGILGKT